MDNNKETVTITIDEYDELKNRNLWLSCLEGAGVDNWQGWDMAIKLWEEEFPNKSIPR